MLRRSKICLFYLEHLVSPNSQILAVMTIFASLGKGISFFG